jgi:hypothetical protein
VILSRSSSADPFAFSFLLSYPQSLQASIPIICPTISLRWMQEWKEGDWIGVGKHYPDKPPKVVLEQLEKIISIPSQYIDLIPNDNLCVQDLLQTSLPFLSDTLTTVKPESCWTKLAPTTNLHTLASKPIPPLEFLEKADEAFKQAWFDGAKSFTDWHYRDSRYPLWIVKFWLKMVTAVQGKARWLTAERWLADKWRQADKSQELAAIIDQVRELFPAIAWNKDLGLNVQLTTLELAVLLANDQINNFIIDIMLQLTAMRIRQSKSLSTSTVLLDCVLSHQIQTTEDWRGPPGQLMAHKIKRIKDGAHLLYFPVFNNGNHWIAFLVDFEKRSIRWGDSLEDVMARPTRRIQAVQRWLKFHFGGKPFTEENSLVHGEQPDGYSCAIVTINTIEHAIWGEPLWTARTRTLVRVRKFFDIMIRSQELVSIK